MHPLIETHRAEILALAERHGVGDVRVFGSMARGDAEDTRNLPCALPTPGSGACGSARRSTDFSTPRSCGPFRSK